jgi:hypothetical protein
MGFNGKKEGKKKDITRVDESEEYPDTTKEWVSECQLLGMDAIEISMLLGHNSSCTSGPKTASYAKFYGLKILLQR